MQETREKLAEYAHDAWSGWMKYMFGKGERRGQFKVGSEGEIDVVWIMPAWAVERWTRQMNTPYADLPESEKASDRKEADEMLALIDADHARLVARVAELEAGIKAMYQIDQSQESRMDTYARGHNDGVDFAETAQAKVLKRRIEELQDELRAAGVLVPVEVADTIRRSLVLSESINGTDAWYKRMTAALTWLAQQG